ncbi:response regulator [Desulfosoma sp.]|uniref:response regulator n=1 Tax=Desulfosoma sp. TaxID=2603217 RepID=UPI00404A8449
MRRLAEKELSAPHRHVVTAQSVAAATDLMGRETFDVIVTDIRLPDGDGLDLLRLFREKLPDAEVIMITGYGTVESALQAMKLGAYDYIAKPFNMERLEVIIDRAYERVCLKRHNRRLL